MALHRTGAPLFYSPGMWEPILRARIKFVATCDKISMDGRGLRLALSVQLYEACAAMVVEERGDARNALTARGRCQK